MRVKLCKTKTEFWASGSSSSATENPAFSEQTIMTPAGHVSEAMLARDSHRAKISKEELGTRPPGAAITSEVSHSGDPRTHERYRSDEARLNRRVVPYHSFCSSLVFGLESRDFVWLRSRRKCSLHPMICLSGLCAGKGGPKNALLRQHPERRRTDAGVPQGRVLNRRAGRRFQPWRKVLVHCTWVS
jgi:hypothetical protein